MPYSGPSTSNIAATLVAAVKGSLTHKDAVRCATTGNGALGSAYAAGQAVDGVTLATGDRILLKNQTTQSENGIYIVTAGTPTRATDADAWAELVGASVSVRSGTANASLTYICTVAAGGTLGSTNVTWAVLN